MNRYALEMYALEKHQNLAPEIPSRKPSISTNSLRRGLLSRNVLRPTDYPSEPARDDPMTYIYELRCDLVDIDLDEILPMIK
jgi:hypothetical protein